MILRGRQPDAARPAVAAMDSGTFEMNTAAMTAVLTPPPPSRLRPITAVSGTPSSTMPRTIAGAEPAACPPPESLRSAPPNLSMIASPTKKVSAPANRPRATPPLPADVVTASSTSS